MDLTDLNCPLLRYAQLTVTSLDVLQIFDVGNDHDLGTPPVQVGEQDWSLLAMAREKSSARGVMLLTNDEPFLNWAQEELLSPGDMTYEVIPNHTFDFLGGLHVCRGLTYAELGSMLEAERQHLETRLDEGTISEERYERKAAHINKVIREAAITETRRDGT